MTAQKLQHVCSRRHGANVRRVLHCCAIGSPRNLHLSPRSVSIISSIGSRRASQSQSHRETHSQQPLSSRGCICSSSTSASTATPQIAHIHQGHKNQSRQTQGQTQSHAAILSLSLPMRPFSTPTHSRPALSPGTGLLAHATVRSPSSRPHSTTSKAAFSLPRRPTRLGSPYLLTHPSSSFYRRRRFTTSAAMSARILDGTAIAKSIRERIGTEIAEKQKLNPRYKPCLKIIQGTHSAQSFSLTYLSRSELYRKGG